MNKVAHIDEAAQADVDEPQELPGLKRRHRRELLQRGLVALVLIAAALGLVAYFMSGRYVSTENAFIQADKLFMSAEVGGRAVAVLVRTNQEVAAGDVLFSIDDESYRISVTRAEAEVAAKKNEIEGLRASYQEKVAALATAEENIAYAEREFTRQEALVKRGVASRSKFDEVEHDVRLAKSLRAEIRQELGSIRARLGGDPSVPAERNPDVLRALAALEQARLDLAHTTVTAPEDATVAAVSLQPGEYVEPGRPMLSLIAKSGLWITANFKETDLTHVRVGQKATVDVDIYPGETWHGTVGSISPATGAEFALIPPQNATGNWVKVTQRVPVRVYLEDYDGEPALRAGLSAVVEIDTERESGFGEFVTSIF